MRRGFTLLELVVSIAMTALLLGTLSFAYKVGIDYVQRSPARFDAYQESGKVYAHLTSLLEHAYLSSSATDNTTYFVATSSSNQAGSVDTIVFTTLGRPPLRSFLYDTETNFETLHDTYGPQGGVEEAALSTVPVGGDAQGEGIFLREQDPPDTDITQGGQESLLIPDARDLFFEFWDGSQWATTWDTRSGQRRLPAAVRMTWQDADNNQVTRVIRLPNSDITSENPLQTGATQ